VSLLKKAGSTVVEYFEWDLPKFLAKWELNFVDYFDNRRFSSEPDVVKYNKTLIAKGSSQNLMRSSMTKIVSYYMTSFMALNHERVRYPNGL
jgi:hypothetical protein